MTRARPTRFEAVAVGFDMALSRRVPQGEGLRSDLSLQSLSEDSRGTTTEMAALTIVSRSHLIHIFPFNTNNYGKFA